MTALGPDWAALDKSLFDTTLETHVLTDRAATKVLPCRECRRPCVVTTFAAPAKTACNNCRHPSREHAVVAQTDVAKLDPELFDLSLEPHHVTKSDKAKWAPCSTCRRPCLVSVFAVVKLVRCHKHARQRKTPPTVALLRPRLDPFELLISDAERAARFEGRTLTVRVQVDKVSFQDNHLVHRVRDYNPETELLRFYAWQGGQRAVHREDILAIK